MVFKQFILTDHMSSNLKEDKGDKKKKLFKLCPLLSKFDYTCKRVNL